MSCFTDMENETPSYPHYEDDWGTDNDWLDWDEDDGDYLDRKYEVR